MRFYRMSSRSLEKKLSGLSNKTIIGPTSCLEPLRQIPFQIQGIIASAANQACKQPLDKVSYWTRSSHFAWDGWLVSELCGIHLSLFYMVGLPAYVTKISLRPWMLGIWIAVLMLTDQMLLPTLSTPQIWKPQGLISKIKHSPFKNTAGTQVTHHFSGDFILMKDNLKSQITFQLSSPNAHYSDTCQKLCWGSSNRTIVRKQSRSQSLSQDAWKRKFHCLLPKKVEKILSGITAWPSELWLTRVSDTRDS